MLILSFLIAFAVSVLVAWLLYRADKKRAVPYPLVTASLRGLITFLTIILIIAPKINQRNTEEQKPIVLFLQDNSSSFKAALGSDSVDYKKKVSELNNQLAKDYRLITWNLDGAKQKDSLYQFDASSTNLAKAIDEATELYGQQNLSAIILASDGWYNIGNNPLYSEIPLNGSLYSIAIGDTSVAQDLRITKIYANKSTSLNSQWEVRADIVANRCNGIQQTVQLIDASGNVVASAPISINNDKYDGNVSFLVKANKAGLQQYSISVGKAGDEKNLTNNKVNLYVDVVEEKKKILLLAATPHPDIKAIAEALKGLDQYELTVKFASEMPNNFQEYACIVLHQLPSNNNSIPVALLRNKSVWYIAGIQNNYFELNQLQNVIKFGMGITTRGVEPQYNKGFNSFTLPANIASISDFLPPLSVSANELTAQANVQTLWQDNNEKPLWAILSSKHATAVLSGEGIWRWRMYEYKNTQQHTVVDECIRQTINYLSNNHNGKVFRTEMPKYVWTNPEYVQLNAFLYNANNELINQPEVKLSLTDSTGQSKNYVLERNGSAYRINMGALPEGKYTYTASTSINSKTLIDKGSFVVTVGAIESQENGCNYALMYALAQKNNGATFTLNQLNAVYDSIKNNSSIRPILNEQLKASELINWKWIFFLILLVATTEWLLRKYWMAM